MGKREDSLALLSLDDIGGGKFGPQFNVTGRAHERGDSSMGSVSSPASSLGSVDLDVLDNQLIGLKLLGNGIRLKVLQEALDDLD